MERLWTGHGKGFPRECASMSHDRLDFRPVHDSMLIQFPGRYVRRRGAESKDDGLFMVELSRLYPYPPLTSPAIPMDR